MYYVAKKEDRKNLRERGEADLEHDYLGLLCEKRKKISKREKIVGKWKRQRLGRLCQLDGKIKQAELAVVINYDSTW